MIQTLASKYSIQKVLEAPEIYEYTIIVGT